MVTGVGENSTISVDAVVEKVEAMDGGRRGAHGRYKDLS